MSCEALIRGAKRIVAVEKNKKTAKICKLNLEKIQSTINDDTKVQVLQKEVLAFLRRRYQSSSPSISLQTQKQKFDLVYLDPPYNSDLYSKVLFQLLKENWLRENSSVICEHSADINLKTPIPWIEKDRRKYGSTKLLIVSPPKDCSCDTGSKLQPEDQTK